MSHSHEPGGQSRSSSGADDGPRFAPDRLDARPVKPSKLGWNLGMLAFGILFIAAISTTGANFSRLADFPANFLNYSTLMVQGVFQPLTPEVQAAWTTAFSDMLESVQIAWIGTVVGALFSLPMGFLAARNMTPLPLYAVVRFILSVIRAVPEIVFAIAVMLPIFGLGPLAGALALGVSSIGTLSKLISEAIEGVDPGPLESSRAAGATKLQMIRWAVLPQVMPEVIAIWLYRFEVNIRASAILGVLGAGGIGSLLSALFNVRAWDRIGITLVVIIVVTIIIDQISAWIRHRVIHGAPKKQVRASVRADDSGDGPVLGTPPT
ncbi:phosphonate ABC transporter, permease protein PhnE [Nesterenkonia sp. PF2B19]|uniref:phosphonate ABC transporter, permease protein PhnE n=1 Tax=unclassified Nesterenkonia TaxID=2629769 RepID=UPI000872A6B4|nr:phosphonate ABC transporter, permease protein PhnE [Nesterenkonia sp. PF2B19]OSM43327.1 phosphonate ABC transporter, permease protein PhnE [Nesterenkonia sp. PF2B19]